MGKFTSSASKPQTDHEDFSDAQRGRSQDVQNRFIFGQNGNSALAGAALGAGYQYFLNNLLNPCRNGDRNGNKKVTNNIIFTGNPTIDNGALGFIAGFATSAILNNGCG